MNSKTALVLTCYPIDKPRHGGQLRSAAIFDSLQKSGWHAHTISIFNSVYFPESNALSEVHIDHGDERRLVDAGGRPDLDVCALIESDESKAKKLLKAILDLAPDVVLLEQPWLWPFIRRNLGSINAKIIYSSQNVESEMLYDRTEHRDSLRSRRNSAKCYALENDFAIASAGTIAVSALDASKLGRADKTPLIAGNGISSLREFPPIKANKASGERYALFTSSAHPPNAEGFFELLGDVAGDLGPGEAIYIVGGICDILSAHRSFAAWGPLARARLQLIGIVDQEKLDQLIAGATVILLPITSGGGSNLKTAEALYSRRPVIGTAKSFRGFETYLEFPNVEIADSPTDFQACLKKALVGPPDYHQLGEASKQILDQLTWAQTLLSLPRFLTELCRDTEACALEDLLTFGWHDAESDGVWSSERIAGLSLPRAFLRGSNRIILLLSFFNPDNAKCKVTIFNRFRKIGETAATDDKAFKFALEIQADQADQNLVELFFRNEAMISPSANGGTDVRQLGVRLLSVTPIFNADAYPKNGVHTHAQSRGDRVHRNLRRKVAHGTKAVIWEVIRCHFDTIDGYRIEDQGQIYIRDGYLGCPLIRGWCFTQKAKIPLLDFSVTLEGDHARLEVDHEYGLSRPDVAAAYGKDSLVRCGFEMFVPPNVPSGSYKLLLSGHTLAGEFVTSAGVDVIVE